MQTLRIFSDITDETLADVVRQLADVKDGEDVTLQICSAGGYVFCAFGIIDYLHARHFRLTAEVLGMAASAAALIALSCDRVKMCEFASLMLHSAYVHSVTATDEYDEGIRRANALQLEIIKRRCPDFTEDSLNNEQWFSARRAVELGLADEIISDANAVTAICNGYLALMKSTFSDKEEKVMNENEEKKDAIVEDKPVSECGDNEVKAEDVSSDDLIEKIVERLDAIEHRLAVLEGEGKRADDEIAAEDDSANDDDAIMNRRKALYAKLTQSAVSAVPAKASAKTPRASKINLKSFLD